MYKYLFGPVPSRRLGMSLGVDLIPHKICTLNCVYCECGKTTKLTTERKEYIPVEDVINELKDYFENNPKPDYFTFSGAGEPTLNSGFGRVLEFIKENSPSVPIAVLTNGSLLSDKQVRKELLNADVVLPSLDAAIDETFRKIDRPSKQLNINDYIKGLVEFRKEFKGKIWLEVFILPGYNDDKKNLDALKKAILEINPDSVQLNTLDRPGTIDKIVAAPYNSLVEIKNYWNLDNVEIIASAPKRKEVKSYRDDMENAILETIKRRPCTLEDLAEILGTHINEVNKYLGVLEADNHIEITKMERGIFYQLKN
ncbi:MAG: radical SAM protein [Saprospiraceae bacterium]|nr:radical SAM protein [Saprospiraceae bacterium]